MDCFYLIFLNCFFMGSGRQMVKYAVCGVCLTNNVTRLENKTKTRQKLLLFKTHLFQKPAEDEDVLPDL